MTCQILFDKFLDVSAVLRACCASVHSFLVWLIGNSEVKENCIIIVHRSGLQRALEKICALLGNGGRCPLAHAHSLPRHFVIILVLFVVCRLKRTCDPLGLVSPSTKRFVLCELDTVILVRSFKAVPLLSPNSPLFSLETMRVPSFSADYFANSKFSPAPVRAHLGHSSAMSGRQSTVGSPSGHSTGNSRKGYIFEPRWNSDVPETRAPDPHGFARGGGEVPHLGHCASLALHLALHCISRSLRLSGITPLKENETLDDIPGGAFPWPGYIGHFRGTTRTRASLPIALAQPAGFPSGFELRDGLLKARGTCLLGLGRVVLVTDHSDTVERSLCNSGSLPGGKSRAGASPGTHQVTLNAVIFLFGHGTRLELSH
ncbi:hypothetical protein PAPYR_11612 [Paratrimastix pyriformis]|uniref:Uncharacterized protein n=1 Tax=Paratrimastix pyriformis TaxID=342808 RepID=A0ABQ8U8Z1_9EUKA|nr:hypothetical protein PAPYR_11612 [Paratrimastix pyriformis]